MADHTDKKIPVIIITGFLGSGKTTILNHIVKQPEMKATAVIINEFGEVGIDHMLVETSEEQMIEMNNGCICCTIRGDLADKLGSLAMWLDSGKVVLVMNVAPLADASSKFSDKVQYVFHTESRAGFGMPGTKVDIICTFDAAQKIQCWVGDKGYVTGDASATGGLAADDGSFKVFAGLRDDPFFFNLAGFQDAVTTVEGAASALTFDAAGCPAVDPATSAALVGMLGGTAMGTMPASDFFAGKNVLSIVLSVDKAMLNAGGPIMSFWGSTNQGGA